MIRSLIICSVSLVCTLGCFLATAASDYRKPAASKETAARAKARHYFLLASQYAATDRDAEAAELFKKSYMSDTTYAEAALEYGLRRWGVPSDTLETPAERERSKSIARKFTDAYPGDLFPNLLYSSMMQQDGDMDEAIRVLETLDRHNSGNTAVLTSLVRAYLDSRRFNEALETYDRYERIEGADIETLIRKAGMLIAMGDTAKAIEETIRKTDEHPRDPQYRLFLSQLYSFCHKPDSVLVNLRRAEAMSEAGMGGNVKIQLADYYQQQGDSVNYDNMVYEALLAEDLDFSTKRTLLGYYLQNMLRDKSSHSRGDKLFDVLRGQNPHDPAMLSFSARYNAAKGDFDAALEDLDYAIDLNHTDNDLWEQAMVYCLAKDDYTRGLEYFNRASGHLHPMPMRLYSLAASCAMMDEKAKEALAYLRKSLEENFPGQSLDAPIDQKALRDYLSMSNFQDLTSLYLTAGDAFFLLDDKEKAYQNYENALLLDDSNPLALNNYAYYLVRDGGEIPVESLQKADEMSQRAITLAPDNPTYVDTRAWVLYALGEYEAAKEMELRAIELAGDTLETKDGAEYFNHLGDIYYRLGEQDEAMSNWQKALHLKADDFLREKIKRGHP